MAGAKLVGVGIVKNYPTPTGGPGGTLPPGLWHPELASCATNMMKTCGEHNLLSSLKVLVSTLSPFLNFCKKNEILPKMTKTQKNTKIVRMRSYSQYEMSKKSASRKYKVLIFGTNEGDFSGTPVKNQ